MSAHEAEWQARQRQLRDGLPVDNLPIKWMANSRAQEVISQLDNLPNCRHVSLHYTQDLTGKFHKLINDN